MRKKKCRRETNKNYQRKIQDGINERLQPNRKRDSIQATKILVI